VIIAEREGYAPHFEEFRKLYNTSNEPSVIDITLDRGGDVEGVILDKENGEPIPRATVLVDLRAREPHAPHMPYDIWTSDPVLTDDSGFFHVDLVPSGQIKIRAVKEDYSLQESSYLELEKDKTLEFELQLERKTEKQRIKESLLKDQSLRGIVKDSSGFPLEGVMIHNFLPFANKSQETYTNARGEFRFEREKGYVVVAEKTGYAPLFHEFRDEYYQCQKQGKGFFRIEITLTKGGIVSGVIRSETDNEAIPGAEVWLDRWAKDLSVKDSRYQIWKGDPVKTDEQGHFLIDYVPDGRLRVRAKAKGFAENISPEFEFESGAEKEISLDLYHGMDIRTSVLDKETKMPIKEASISLLKSKVMYKDDIVRKTGDQDGVCLFQNVPLGNYRISCWAKSYKSLDLEDIVIIDKKQGLKELEILMVPEKQP